MPTALTETSTFTDPVQVPDDGDDRNAASIEGTFQALANRTLNLKDRLDGLHNDATWLSRIFKWTGLHTFADARLRGSSELLYADADGALAPRLRAVQMPLTDLAVIGTGSYIPPSNGILPPGTLSAGTGGITAVGALRVPRGCTLKGAHFSVSLPAATQATLKLFRVTPTDDGSGVPVCTQLGATMTATVGGSTYDIDVTEVSAPDTSTLLVEATLPDGGTLYGLAYSYLDVGPRNP